MKIPTKHGWCETCLVKLPDNSECEMSRNISQFEMGHDIEFDDADDVKFCALFVQDATKPYPEYWKY